MMKVATTTVDNGKLEVSRLADLVPVGRKRTELINLQPWYFLDV